MRFSSRAVDSHQNVIQSYFQSRPSFWKDAYEREHLQARIYQHRRDCALRFFRGLALPVDSAILEIGCGAGVLAVSMAQAGYRIHVMDNAPAMLDLTDQRSRDAGLQDRILIELGDIHALPFHDHSLDVVLALGVMPWLPCVRKALSEVHRVLRPGGHFIVTFDNRGRINNRLDFLLSARRWIGRWLRACHLRDGVVSRPHGVVEARRSLEQESFDILAETTLGFGPFTLAGFRILPDGLGLVLDRWLTRQAERVRVLRTAGSQYVVLAQRR